MMEDNVRYTAMRIFQEIEGADVIYINTYAATTPRLSTFKKICSNNSKEPELLE
jgi:mRNA degradation ribonuclease J1/J2